MCIVLLPPGDNPIAVNKYIIYQIIKCHKSVLVTNVTTVINQKDLMQETVRCAVCNAVHCPQKGVVVFIVETNHHTG